MRSREHLEATHRPEAVRSRLAAGPAQSYLGDFVLGAIDGAVTTFAVIAGATGAHLSAGLVLIFGVANILADGFSMAVGNYLGTRADEQRRERLRAEEREHLRAVPAGEREEVRQLLAARGLAGDDLERVVAALTAAEEPWIETMLREEHGLPDAGRSALRAGASTFVAFTLVGSVPLVVFVIDLLVPGLVQRPIVWSGLLAAACFFVTGVSQAYVVGQRPLRAGLETLALGGGAALLAYAVGWLLQGFAASA